MIRLYSQRQGGRDCPRSGPCEASVLASVLCELSTARSEDGAARRPRPGQLCQDPPRMIEHIRRVL